MPNIATLVVLQESMDSDDEKPHRGKRRKQVKRRRERGYFNNFIREIRIEDRAGFREILRIDVTDFELILTQISDLISLQERLGGTNPNECDEKLALTLTEFTQTYTIWWHMNLSNFLSFHYKTSLNAVTYIVKGCSKAIVEQMASAFVKVPSTKAE